MRKVYVGLDVGSRGCEVAAMDQDGVILERRSFTTSEKNLITVFEALKGEIHVHLEASELTAWIRSVIKPIVTRVVVSHPKSNLWIGRDPLKNDRIDATKLAEMLRSGKPHEVYYADDDGRVQFKRLVQHYDKITREEAGLKRMIKGRLRAQGVIVKDLTIFKPEGRCQALERVTCPVARATIEQLYELLGAALKAQRAALGLLRQESKRYPEIALFLDVPGIGLILASRFSAYVQTPHRFANKRKVWRYCRLGIAWRKSDGLPLNHQALDRNGCGALKDLSRKAFMASLTTKKDNAFKLTYLASCKNTGDKTHARLTVQRKIVATLWTMWRKGEKYIDSCTG